MPFQPPEPPSQRRLRAACRAEITCAPAFCVPRPDATTTFPREAPLGIVGVSQCPPANPQDHRPVPPQQHLESRLIAPCEESLQQLSVRRVIPGRPESNLAEILHDVIHVLIPRPATAVPILHCLKRRCALQILG